MNETSRPRYTNERNAQIVIALLKAHGIRDLVISPGATNDTFVLSVQDDPDFTLYSAVDERHAGYLACGLAQETGRPVVINCTGATASRNYMPALTEAYYRKLPVLAITCSQHYSHLGNLNPQMTDRAHLPSDVANLSVQCPIPHTDEEIRDCELKVNRALLALTHRGGGPAHINLETSFSQDYSAASLPPVRKISRVMPTDADWPALSTDAKIVVWIGSHRPFSPRQEKALASFLQSHNAVAIGDCTSNCPLAIKPARLLYQYGSSENPDNKALLPDLIIHIGEVSGDYPTLGWLKGRAPVWRVNEDGELRNILGWLSTVFEMPEEFFFEHYVGDADVTSSGTFAQVWKTATLRVQGKSADLPFSNMWIAETLAPKIPAECNIHLGILNPLRCWNMVQVVAMHGFSTVGGFGIDGGTSSMLGTALAKPSRLNFGIFGDLSFFYDLNAIANRHVGNNLRILVVNNGEGGEFSAPGSVADNPCCGERVHDFIAAKGHFGSQSPQLVRHYAEDLGFEYLSASTKEEFLSAYEHFVSDSGAKSIVFECFTTAQDDRAALNAIRSLEPYSAHGLATGARTLARTILPQRVKNAVKELIR